MAKGQPRHHLDRAGGSVFRLGSLGLVEYAGFLVARDITTVVSIAG
jgi:hypothetical protein